jgi:hypothetical protein
LCCHSHYTDVSTHNCLNTQLCQHMRSQGDTMIVAGGHTTYAVQYKCQSCGPKVPF